MTPPVMDGLGAEIFPKWIPHLGANTRQVHANYPKKGLNPQKYLGSPLSGELWKFVTDECGCNRISVFFHKENIELALEMKYRCCILTVTEDGFLVSIHPHYWYKAGHVE